MLGNQAGRSGGRPAPREVRVDPVWRGETAVAAPPRFALASRIAAAVPRVGWGNAVKEPRERRWELGPFLPQAGRSSAASLSLRVSQKARSCWLLAEHRLAASPKRLPF